jgi:hypothetical protein
VKNNQADRFFLKVYFESDNLPEEDKKIHINKYIKRLIENLKNKQTFVEECEIVSIKKEFANLKLKILT